MVLPDGDATARPLSLWTWGGAARAWTMQSPTVPSTQRTELRLLDADLSHVRMQFDAQAERLNSQHRNVLKCPTKNRTRSSDLGT